MTERPSLQREVRGVSDKVKLLEDVLVGFINAHKGLLAYLTSERNRSRLLSTTKKGSKEREILTSAFKEVDRSNTRYKKMIARMHELNGDPVPNALKEEFAAGVASALERQNAPGFQDVRREFEEGVQATVAHAQETRRQLAADIKAEVKSHLEVDGT